MSNSNLHTTALATGGTTFDTATCIGGKCEYPLIESDNYAKVYYHNMVCTQNKYEKLALNTNMTASTGKPDRSPFDDDADAFYVGDFSINPIGNGLVSFQRVFATVPEEHIEPYGLYARELPAYTTTGFTANNTDFDGLTIKEQYSTDGSTWVDRTTASLGDNKVMGSTIDGETGVTVNNSTLDWTQYTYVRLHWEATYTGTVATISDGSPIDLKGGFDGVSFQVGSVPASYNTLSNFKAKIQLLYRYNAGLSNYTSVKRKVYNSAGVASLVTETDGYNSTSVDLGDLIVRSTSGSVGSKTIIATTSPYNLAQYHSETIRKDFGGIYIGSKIFRGVSIFNSYTGTSRRYEYYFNPRQDNGDNDTTFSLPSFTRAGGIEENCPAHIVYNYIRTDQPELIQLKTKDVFPYSLDIDTSPTTDEYLESIRNIEYFNAENQFVERYMGNIYRLGQIRTIVL